ncbi:MAG: DUF4956 domain-containing protein [Planctomycetaceae bacterium]|nr:DUF4956 domain-containing protein [Planctomycetaceae bacterium]MCP4462734.1 DUF4956 domain-containing protein [Planctomycetaceae bacterium]MDG1806609.1 DUF4956 domain-containing protein [Pirellulaceae bacterium]MDG2103648.1 DUF4956 domain-containing protein [Pirellulaceae bacterium]
MEFLGVPLFDNDLYKLVVRFFINLIFLALVVGLCYNRHQKSRVFMFNFVLMNVTVFFICFTLKKLDLGLGMALGLFAIFAILRYRTDAIRVKEMTYLFIVIGIAVINSLANKKTSYAELMATNCVIIAATYLMESLIRVEKVSKQDIVYDRIDLLKPDKRSELYADIEQRTGLIPTRIKTGKIDFLKPAANITVHFEPKDSE